LGVPCGQKGYELGVLEGVILGANLGIFGVGFARGIGGC